MPRWITRRSRVRAAHVARPRWVAAVCCGALALSAYGLGDTAAFAKQSKATVAAAKVTGVGTVLVDAKGRTLYTLTNAGQAVPCTGQCAVAWPPLLVKAASAPKGGRGVTGLGTVLGGQQVTVNALPLHRFAGDTKAGQASGEGISSFGGVWHVVKGAGSGTSTSPTPTTTGKSSSSKSSNGY
jgi:predicted lipoprotein with Yx(FWY)xxD motif